MITHTGISDTPRYTLSNQLKKKAWLCWTLFIAPIKKKEVSQGLAELEISRELAI